MNPTRMLVDGAILSAAATALILTSLWTNPRLWLNDFPPDIKQKVPPKTDAEKKASLRWGLPLMALLLGGPLVSTLLVEQAAGGEAAFTTLFLHAFVVSFLFNLVDLIVIDWLVICTWTPPSLVIPGTEGMAGYKDYGHHFRHFLIGTVFSAVVALVVASLLAIS